MAFTFPSYAHVPLFKDFHVASFDLMKLFFLMCHFAAWTIPIIFVIVFSYCIASFIYNRNAYGIYYARLLKLLGLGSSG